MDGVADRLLAGRLDGDDEGEVVLGVTRFLQDRFQTDVFAGKDSGKSGDNSRAVIDTEAEIIGAFLERYRDRLVFTQAFVGKGRNALGAAAADLARDAHQIADHG